MARLSSKFLLITDDFRIQPQGRNIRRDKPLCRIALSDANVFYLASRDGDDDADQACRIRCRLGTGPGTSLRV